MADVAARNRRNRDKGARWQNDLRNGLRNQGLDVERLVLTGKEDEGDLLVRLAADSRVVIEAKDAAMDVARFVGQALVEADHYAAHRGLDRQDVRAIAVVKRRGKGWRDAYVLTTVADYFRLDSS